MAGTWIREQKYLPGWKFIERDVNVGAVPIHGDQPQITSKKSSVLYLTILINIAPLLSGKWKRGEWDSRDEKEEGHSCEESIMLVNMSKEQEENE